MTFRITHACWVVFMLSLAAPSLTFAQAPAVPHGNSGEQAVAPTPADGSISGVVVDPSGQPMTGRQVALVRIDRVERSQTDTVTTSRGSFEFSALTPGHYRIEVPLEGRVLTSGAIALVSGAMQVIGVTVTAPPLWALTDMAVPDLLLSGADKVLGGNAVPSTFEALREVLQPGQAVIVQDRSGHEVRGRISSVSDSTLVLIRHRLFHAEAWRTSEPFVSRIKVVDSTRDGVGLGFAVALGGMAINYKICSPNCGSLWGLPWMLVMPVAMVIGGAIDDAHNGVVYANPHQPARVAVVPLLGRGQVGVAGQVTF